MKFSLLQGIMKEYIDTTGIYSRNLSILNFNERILSLSNPFLEDFTMEEKVRFITIVFHNLDEFIQTRLSRLKKDSKEFKDCCGLIQTMYDRMNETIRELIKSSELSPNNFDEDSKIDTYLITRFRRDSSKQKPAFKITKGNLVKYRTILSMCYGGGTAKAGIMRVVKGYPEYLSEMMTETIDATTVKVTYSYMKAEGEIVAIQMGNLLKNGSRELDDLCQDNGLPIIDKDCPVTIFWVPDLLLSCDFVRYVPRSNPVPILPDTDMPVLDVSESEPLADMICKNYIYGDQKKELLVYTPYVPYDCIVLPFIETMIQSDLVTEIAMTVYRMELDSPIVSLLQYAASVHHKEVYVYVEVSARGNEESNMDIIQILQSAGVHVGYRFKGYKVHAKMFVAKYRTGLDEQFQETFGYYTHLSTGNYSIKNAKGYTDIQLITPNTQVGEDALHFVRDILCNPEEPEPSTVIAPAIGIGPNYLREKITELIQNEMLYGEKGRIWIKCNSICDRQIVSLLRNAASIGCDVKLIIRTGIGVIADDHINIHSKIGRFLEHERLYIFGHDGAYMSSADLMTRNLSKRIETLYRFALPGETEFIRAVDYFSYAWNDRFSQEIVWEKEKKEEAPTE